ncbi:MAG: hypothetical protein KatS3mg009_1389 [Acidimicrobiia bacterium]|nr:MAG: hypothetical protein KatS3mg009_1389 [Acidimicrobiia bacterium]
MRSRTRVATGSMACTTSAGDLGHARLHLLDDRLDPAGQLGAELLDAADGLAEGLLGTVGRVAGGQADVLAALGERGGEPPGAGGRAVGRPGGALAQDAGAGLHLLGGHDADADRDVAGVDEVLADFHRGSWGGLVPAPGGAREVLAIVTRCACYCKHS